MCKVNATSSETLESHSQGKKHRAKAKAAHAKLNSVPVVEAASNSHGNDSQPKASAETTGSEPVEDGKLLPTSEADAVDLTIGLSKKEAGHPYTCRSKSLFLSSSRICQILLLMNGIEAFQKIRLET